MTDDETLEGFVPVFGEPVDEEDPDEPLGEPDEEDADDES